MRIYSILGLIIYYRRYYLEFSMHQFGALRNTETSLLIITLRIAWLAERAVYLKTDFEVPR